MRGARDEDVQPGAHARVEQPGCECGERPRGDQVTEGRGPHDELTDVDGGVVTCDVRDNDVQAFPPGSAASTNGLDRSSRRPDDLSICSTR